MLVDLGRNDVGRVAEVRQRRVSDVMTVERYSHVMHISSTVTGTTASRARRPSMRCVPCLPAGTFSGAPKVRAMQIIDELEPHRRGPYGGAVGYVDFSGNMDTCIALRTMVVARARRRTCRPGPGSSPTATRESEYQETVNKAKGLLRALEIAETQL